MSAAPEIDRTIRRVRHELTLRLLEVRQVARPTRGTVRVTLGGAALAGFASPGFDDHVKLFFPEPGQDRPALPEPGGGPRPVARDYTPRRHDPAAGILEIEFALHGAGPATRWAAQARPGQLLGVGGPRGSMIVPGSFDWYLLAGDETALPAIARRLEELPAGARALVIAEVANAGEERPLFGTAAHTEVTWLHRAAAAEPATLLARAIAAMRLPPGDGYAWVAAEADAARAARQVLLDRHALPRPWVKASGYWKRDTASTHVTYDD